MKFSYQWLRELVPDLSADPVPLYTLITTKTAECEGIEPVGAHFATVVAARVLSVEPLPKGKNKSVVIETPDRRTVTVVCGAPNVRPGILAAWLPPGTSLGDKTIGKAIIEGVQSEGMLASAAELGINHDHSGLLELTEEAFSRLGPDWIIEIDNKSLTHRPDLWGHYGMAREVAAITGCTLIDPVDLNLLPGGDVPVKIEIADRSLCSRYSALVVENVTVASSPLWLQARLESVGLNSINNLVDLTNYILAELPQPMHAFDADKLVGNTIYVRPARAGEHLEALNGETYELQESDLVIADASGPIALAGVIGGAASAISQSTTRIVLESANFKAAGVRLSSARHKLRTDASMRFEKSLDPENTVRGLARAVALLQEIGSAGRVVGGVIDNRVPAPELQPIALTLDFVTRKLGKHVTEEQTTGILNSLGFCTNRSSPGSLSVTVPTWRATKDIGLKDDLVEEIGRMIGYGSIEPVAPRVASVVPPSNPMRSYLRRLRRTIADEGFSEVYNYSFVTAEEVQRFHFDLASHIGVRNPIASELSHLRRSLLPGILKNIVSNVRNYQEFRLFEIGNEIHPAEGPNAPEEITHLTAALYDVRANEQTFFEMKRVLECLFPDVRLREENDLQPYEHPSRAAQAYWGGQNIGRLFELHPSLLIAEGIEGRAVLFDIDLRQALAVASQRQINYKPLRKYPTSGFDLSAVATARTPAGDIEAHLSQAAGEDLVALHFVRQYSGPPLPEGHKSVSYHLEIGRADHTLTSDEVTAIRERIVKAMQGAGFEIRGLD